MDLRIPEPEDGLRLIQAIAGQARIIVLSGGQVDPTLPVDEFLTKPCPSKRLLESIAEVDIRVKVIPKSSKTELAGYLPDGTWKIKVAAAPEKGKANRALVEFLAEHLGVREKPDPHYVRARRRN